MAEQRIGTKAARGSLWMGASSYVRFVIAFGTGIFLARQIAPAVFGTVALATALLGFLRVITGVGLHDFLARRKDLEPKVINTVFAVTLILGLGVVLISLLAAPLLARFYSRDIVWLIIFLAGINFVAFAGDVPHAMLLRRFELKTLGLIQFFTSIIGCAAAISIVLAGGRMSALVVQSTSGLVLNAAFYFILAPEKIGIGWDREVFREVAHKAKSFLGTTSIGVMTRELDKVLVGTFLKETQLGFYNRARGVTKLFSVVVPSGVARAVLPAFSLVLGDRKRLANTFDLLASIYLLVLAPLCVALFFSIEALMEFLYGAPWLPSAPIFKVLTPVLVLGPISGIMIKLHIALNHPQRMMRARLTGFIVLIPALAAGLKMWGPRGAAMAMVLFAAVELLALIRYTKRELGWKTTLRPLLRHGFAAVVTFLVMMVVSRRAGFADLGNEPRIICVGAVVGVTYLALIAAVDWKQLSSHLRFLIARVLSRQLEAAELAGGDAKQD